MNDTNHTALLSSLQDVDSGESFEQWIRYVLRRSIPHAVLLCTLGKLVGIGSVPTHRIGVDYPLNLAEALKNRSGALDDPLMVRWFKSGRPSYINVFESHDCGHQNWRRTMLRYGIRGMSIHGYLDHSAKRFVAFQLGNPGDGGSIENLNLLSKLSSGMAAAAWRSIEARSSDVGNGNVCHPMLTLTTTELHIIELLAQGLSNKEIARRRGVSDSTVKTQVQRTGAKLGATRRAEIVAIAMPLLTRLPAQSVIDYGGD